MLNKKIALSACLLFALFMFGSLVRAETDTIDTTVSNIKTTVEEKLPEATKSWQEQILPFCQKTFTNVETWLQKNMPAAAKEFSEEARTMPGEIWNAIVFGWNWTMGFFKK
ncbi:MAG: hypothetical protein WC470_02415 [Candidatus Paceibacterota bacterium]